MNHRKRNIRTLPKDQTLTTGDQVLIIDKETNLAKLVNQENFRGERGVSVNSMRKIAETAQSVTIQVLYSDGSTSDFILPKGPQGDP